MTVFVIGTALILPVFSADLDAIGGPGMLWFWLTPVGGSLLLLSALATHASPGWVARQVALIGRHSYSIYLWHILVGILWLNALCGQLGLRLTLPIWVACYLVLSIGSGMVMTHLIEIPALWLRDRWCPDTSRTKRDSAVALTERQAA